MSCDFIFTRDGKFLIKHIFAFHIIKNNFYFYYPDSNHLHLIRFLLHLQWDWDGSPPLLRTARLPSRLLVWSSHCQPLPSQPDSPLPAFTNFTRCQIHSCPYLIPPDSIHHQGIYHPDSRLWRSPTIVITVKTSYYTRNTYIYYYIYLEKHHISEYTHIIAIYTKLLFSHFFTHFFIIPKNTKLAISIR